MGSYLYKGVDRTGEVRTGTIEAVSLQVAREALQKQGIDIQRLDPTRETRMRMAASYHPLPPPPRRTLPWRALGLIAVLGLLVAGGYHALQSYAPRPGLKPGETTRHVELIGSLELDAPVSEGRSALEDVRLAVIFPEIPVEIAPDVELDSRGSFRTSVYFLSQQPPTRADVVARLTGYETVRLTDLKISEEKLRLPPIQLKRGP